MTDMKPKILGSINGHLVGDALGVPYEFTQPSDIPSDIKWGAQGTHRQPVGTWSDDGALMLCTLASLCEKAEFDAQDVGRRFVKWMDNGYMAAGGLVFDYGRTTRCAIDRLRRQTSPLDAGPASCLMAAGAGLR